MAVKQLTRTVPIVFTGLADPVGTGIVDSLARPGGNLTGFMIFDFTFAGKYLDLLKQIAPHVTRVAVFRDDTNPAGLAQFGVIQAMATSVGLQVTPVTARSSEEIASAVEAFAHSPNGGAIMTGGVMNTGHRDLILKLIARYKLPAIYQDRVSVANGGLIFYGPDLADQFRRAAGYVDRILKGETGRSPCAGAHQVRTGHQPQNREGPRAHRAAVAACRRRRGDRITPILPQRRMSAFGGKADIGRRCLDVCF